MLGLDEIQKTIRDTENEMLLAEGRNHLEEQVVESAKPKTEKLDENNKLQFPLNLDKETFFNPGKEIKTQSTEKNGTPQNSSSDVSMDNVTSNSSSQSTPDIIKKFDINLERIKSRELTKKRNYKKKIEPSSHENSPSIGSDSIKELSKEENSSKSVDSQDSPKIITRTRKLSNPINFFSEDRNLSPRKITRALKGVTTHEKKELSNGFNESLPINENTMNDCLKKTKSLLQKKDKKIIMVDCEGNPHLQMLVVPQNTMATTENANSKTVILFEKEKIEGEGATATVYKGYDLINKKYWAIKFIKAGKEQRDIEIENLKTRQWLFGCYYLANSRYALIMKFIPGEILLKTLYVTDDTRSKDSVHENYCTSRKDFSIHFKLELICKLLEQLAKLHKKYGLLHRDIKPENIRVYYVNQKLKVRIIDLGDAIPISSKKVGLCGTKGYLDPRIEFTPYDKDADIYSLGVVVTEILTGKNFQQLLRDELKKTCHLICSPNISFEQLELMMDDVLKIESISERYESYEDHINNMDNYIFLQLSILARKMLTAPHPDLFLENEIAALKELKEDCQLFSENIKQLLQHKLNLQNMLNSRNRFFHPELNINISPIVSEATNYFKLIHSPKEEDDNKLQKGGLNINSIC